jgi:hypothetical protein
MEINRQALNHLADLASETFEVTFVSALGDTRTVTDHAPGILAYLMPSDVIVFIQKVTA